MILLKGLCTKIWNILIFRMVNYFLYFYYKTFHYFLFQSLSKEHMYQDFKQLRIIFAKHYPYTTANKCLYSINQEFIFDKYEKKVPALQSLEQFYMLLNDLLRELKGDHLVNNDALFYIQWNYSLYPFNFRQFIKNIFLKDISTRSIFINHFITKKIQRKIFRAVPLVYFEGDFYIKEDSFIGGHKFLAGAKLLEVNNIPAYNLLEKASPLLNKFDAQRKIFYGDAFSDIADNFYSALCHNMKHVKLTFENRGKKEECYTKANTKKQFCHKLNLPSIVLYFNKMLYIRIPSFNLSKLNYYLNEIKRKQGMKINAVILDIRQNSGGSSLVWRAILEQIIHKKYCWTQELAFRKSSHISMFVTNYLRYSDIFLDGKQTAKIAIKKIPILGDQEYSVLSIVQKLIPQSMSLKLNIPIYIIAHDIYSSAGALLSFARNFNNFIIIGNANPTPLGQGVDPCFFSLKKSNYIFSFEPCIDMTNVVEMGDILHNKVDIEVQFKSSKDFLNYINTSFCKAEDSKNIKNDYINWLLNDDPYFEKILRINHKKYASTKSKV